ncbi:MAG TPA: glycosyltransferase family 2 protein [Kofleriaceae bacterium]|nr:glycosyltransferase family 2 protein [Kofleriaceae bacterium]
MIDASIVVRSFNRLPALCELLAALLAQDAPGVLFEIVVVEQSTKPATPEVAARLDELVADPRVRVLRRKPLGGAGARNEGVRATRGRIVLFMDDDDLPGGPAWLVTHLRNFDDPDCIAVSGRQVVGGGEARAPYRDMEKARRQVMSYVPILMWQRAWPRTDRRKRVESMVGGNSAVRRSAMERFGLWDECTLIEDEQSFNYRVRRAKQPGEYLLFDPAPAMVRRFDVPGGMDKRHMTPRHMTRRIFDFQHDVLGHYFPVRFALLYPIYVIVAYAVAMDWVWNELAARGSWRRRLWTSAQLAVELPFVWLGWLAQWTWRRLRRGAPARNPQLAPLGAGGDDQRFFQTGGRWAA